MGNFKVEMMDGDAVLKSTEVQSNSDVQAAKSAVTKPVEPGRAGNGSWLRVTHIASGRTSQFRFA
ncbi:MAG: hypothetical protein E5X53_26385 [Mesorhizobium sp.]|uniref:hypothetical protein n=1 Tax=Mesorhizobium sp. TaxID=1871066 RepID=UPI0011F689E3|nr:hypothetical protein [Mesorhizobium sp.]TIP70593.1 MAG: hypothetical protein E5X55_26635 [Mesorhizobium sp.]TIQ05328.1 MAG: hypothetical protein E5X57_28405 [Mesorhizobium sp.]TIR49027.1 MAG: hypothetical protein E5X53_26385 [Mesorhizobium sp.]TJV94862.1 MAG: hypothetical protein E5X52_26910 [Mesorhizobium sp.]